MKNGKQSTKTANTTETEKTGYNKKGHVKKDINKVKVSRTRADK